MTPEAMMTLGFDAMKVGLALSTRTLLATMVTDLLVSLLQAFTQINKMTLSLIQKSLTVITSLFIARPWMLSLFLDCMRMLFSQLPYSIW